MLVKFIGSLLLTAGTTWIGFEMAATYAKRTKCLRQFIFALGSLQAEIAHGLVPLSTISERLASQVNEPMTTFFHTFHVNLTGGGKDVSKAWKIALSQIHALHPSDKEILTQFGETLGKHDKISAQKQITLAMHHLEKAEKEAEENKQIYEKMVRSLGFFAGLFLSILLY